MSIGKIERAQDCLRLISKIALRGACSTDPDQIGYALQELSQVLVERTGRQGRVFEPVPAHEIEGLEKLLEELDFVDRETQALAEARRK